MCFFPKKWGGREIPLHKIPTRFPKKNKKIMDKVRIQSKTTLDKRSNLEIIDFINNLKNSFEDVILISIEDIQTEYNKHYTYEYRVNFYHNLYIIV